MKRVLRALNPRLFDLSRNGLVAVVATLVFSNLLLNAFVFERFLSPDGHILPALKRGLLAYNVVSLLAALALALAIPRLRDFRVSVRLPHVVLLVVAMEAFLRITVFTTALEIPFLENARLYASPYCGDPYYFVLRHYQDKTIPPKGEPDPLFGWTGRQGELRMTTDAYLDETDVVRPPVLFFGDSFAVWGWEQGNDVPALLDAELPDKSVLNYGVSGYGTDQIWLRFQHEYARFAARRPPVLIGVMLADLDRALLEYRGSQKPYFEVEDGALALRRPAYRTNAEYFEAFDFGRKSLLLSALATPIRKVLRGEDRCTDERFTINRLIFAEMAAFVAANDIDTRIVLFYNHNDLRRRSPREDEIKRILQEVGLTRWIDTKEVLLSYLEQNPSRSGDELFSEVDAGHHSALANRIIAEEIARVMRGE